MFNRFQSFLKDKMRVAHYHQRIPIIHFEKYHLGIVLTAVGWILIAQYTSVLQKTSEVKLESFANQLTRTGIEMSIIYITMSIIYSFFIFSHSKGYYKCENTSGVILRAVFAYISFLTFSFAKMGTQSIDNTILFSLDPVWLIFIMSYIGIRIPNRQKIVIIAGLIILAFVLREDLLSHSVSSWICGTLAGQTLAIITFMTTYLVKRDPPIRIGFYSGIIGALISMGFSVVCGMISGIPTIPIAEILGMVYSGVIFSIALFCFLEACCYTEAYIIGVTSLVLPIFMIWNGWFIDKSTFNMHSLIGTAAVAMATIYVFLSEYIENKKRKHLGDGSIEANGKR